MNAPSESSGSRPSIGVIGALLVALAVVVLASAWLSEDAYITFRVIDNFSNGYGLRWNVAERVQPYTHPLWLLVLLAAHALTGELFLTPIVLGLVSTLGAAAILCGTVSHTTGGAIFAVVAMAGSKAFVDYSTSGLENSLACLLLAGTLAAYFDNRGRRRDHMLAFCAGLAVLNRMDAALIVLPLLVVAARESRSWRRFACALAIGFAPFLIWEIFAVVYYGFPFPNSAYAKLQNGLPQGELIARGIYYLLNSLRLDPITLLTIGAACVLPLIVTVPGSLAPILGLILHLGYVVVIGGDFMSGRFLVAPFFVACAILARVPRETRRFWGLGCLLLLGLSLSSPLSPLRARRDYGRDGMDDHAKVDAHGIADERAYYFQYTGPWRVGSSGAWPNHPWMWDGVRGRESGHPVLPVSHVGFYGYAAGPTLHVVDLLGLADPLLARLPPRTDVPWRMGHFERIAPRGYLETVADRLETSRIRDPEVAALYDSLRLVTRGELFRRDRWAAIWRLNVGG